MPLGLLSDAHQIRPTDVEEHFESRVLGQPEATQAMVDTVLVAKASLNDASKPLGSFFFVGPTGVGKTELAKALAEYLFGSRDRLVRLDMAEYASGDSVQRLIGTAWGSREGELTRRVREQPFCVLLLDEIEKAHWAVFDALLGVLDEGRLTDASGRTADFRNAILIMTSNLGAERARSSGFGFVQGDDGGKTRAYVEEAEKFFRPEFFNRINRIVVFHTLSGQTVRRIAQRELARLLERDGIVRRGLKVEVDDRVVERLASQGFHPRYGARPLQREIERTVIQPLARILVARPLDASEFVRIRLDGDAVTVERERIAEQADPDRRRVRRAEAAELSLGRLEAEAAGFVTDLASDEANGSADEVRSMVSELVANTHAPSFWEDGTRARGVLRSLYQLEQLVGGFDALRERADGLVQFARRVRETHNQARAGEIPAAIEEMRDRLLVLRLELAAAAAGATGDTAQLRVIPIGSADAWAERLLRMYEQWSERTGREYERVGGQTLAIQGPATYGLLRGESGIHKHVRPDGREELARVTLDGDENMGESPIARVYEEGKRRLVRDPRTAARATHVGAVLDEGHIDLFLIAALREATGTTSRE
jgi:hypothetical protein